jgi:4-hydroxybenzoate polyprenyltransferase/phosphoserine phosphatase
MAEPSTKKNPGKTGHLPIVVDLDGTLTPTDTLIESVIGVVKQSPLNLLRAPLWLLKGRAGFKESVAARAGVSAEHLPYREPLIAWLRDERSKGRRIVLATAAHRSIAQAVSKHLGLFDEVLATDAGRNLKGEAKLEAIKRKMGGEFVYAGDSGADLAIWKAARAAVLVGVSPGTAEAVRREVAVEREFPRESGGFGLWLRALRAHQWMKNLLLFVPLLTAFSFLDVWTLLTTVIAFFAFSFAASASYVLNDLWDLENDREHPRKRLRPFASGRIPIVQGLFASAAALVVALALASAVSRSFLLMLLLYLALTSAYSWVLKEHALIDVLTLSLLYTLRIIAGSVAIGIPASSWLLAFSAFTFLSLALVKRCAELVSLEQGGEESATGRDYRVGDLAVLWPLGVGAALSAVVVFGLFISAEETRQRYATPELLWLVALGLVYWLARLWIKTSRGRMDDDPLVYAVKDPAGLAAVFAMIVTMLVAHFVSFGAAT